MGEVFGDCGRVSSDHAACLFATAPPELKISGRMEPRTSSYGLAVGQARGFRSSWCAAADARFLVLRACRRNLHCAFDALMSLKLNRFNIMEIV